MKLRRTFLFRLILSWVKSVERVKMLNFSLSPQSFYFQLIRCTVALTLQNNGEYHYFRQQRESIFIHFCGGNFFWFFLLHSGKIFPFYHVTIFLRLLAFRIKKFSYALTPLVHYGLHLLLIPENFSCLTFLNRAKCLR